MLRQLARTSRGPGGAARAGCARSASNSAPATAPPARSSPRAPRPRLDSLSHLEPAAHRLAFRSLPYAAPPHLIAPSPSQFIHHAPPFFTLRCFPSVPRSPSGPEIPRPRPSAKDSPHPLPFLRGRTAFAPSPSPSPSGPNPNPNPNSSPNPSPRPSPSPSLDPASPFLAPRALRASLAAHAHAPDAPKPYTLDLTLLASKKRVHKSACIRERCKRRVREAVRLVVVRGARAAPPREGAGDRGEAGLVLQEDDLRETGSRKWLAAGHHYIMSITLEVYRCPLPVLVDKVRTALRAVRRKAEAAALARQLADIEISPRARRADAPTAEPGKS
ncbi:hypothetical protein JCM3770_006690 [Rhodotorula araucariae]